MPDMIPPVFKAPSFWLSDGGAETAKDGPHESCEGAGKPPETAGRKAIGTKVRKVLGQPGRRSFAFD